MRILRIKRKGEELRRYKVFTISDDPASFSAIIEYSRTPSNPSGCFRISEFKGKGHLSLGRSPNVRVPYWPVYNEDGKEISMDPLVSGILLRPGSLFVSRKKQDGEFYAEEPCDFAVGTEEKIMASLPGCIFIRVEEDGSRLYQQDPSWVCDAAFHYHTKYMERSLLNDALQCFLDRFTVPIREGDSFRVIAYCDKQREAFLMRFDFTRFVSLGLDSYVVTPSPAAAQVRWEAGDSVTPPCRVFNAEAFGRTYSVIASENI